MKIYGNMALVMFLTLAMGWLLNQPQDAGVDVPQGKLNSLSFAPFWDGQGPLTEVFPTTSQLDADLRLLSGKTRAIRTYASSEGTMPEIPALARKYGLTMIQGAWLGGIKKTNRLEVEELIRSANANPDVVKRVIVGNEVLLRGDLSLADLLEHIRSVKKAVKQPVSYADVWSFYLQHPDLIKEVDFITIHILPYWEDEPVPVDAAVQHIERIYRQVRQEVDSIAPGKPILIGESGWPSAGRQRGWAVPGVVNEAKFIRGLIQVATANGFDYNIVEAINQSWKSALEGTVGANWGLFSASRTEVFPLTGPVYENPHWYVAWLAAVVMLLVLVTSQYYALAKAPGFKLPTVLLFTQALLVVWSLQIEWLYHTCYGYWQAAVALIVVVLNGVLIWGCVQKILEILTKQGYSDRVVRKWPSAYQAMTVYCLFKTGGLAVDGRYIDFPLLTIAVPALCVIGIMSTQWRAHRAWSPQVVIFGQDKLTADDDRARWVELLGYLLISMGFLLIIGETLGFVGSRDLIQAYPDFLGRLWLSLEFALTNRQLLLWLAGLLILALPLLPFRKK